MAKSTLLYGSSGSEVKELQESLNKAGYNLVVDGKFGTKTQNAVKSYQQKNGLTVDGIVGVNTWKSLSTINDKGASTSNNGSKTTNATQNTIKAPVTQKRPTYEKNENVISAENALTEWENSKPEEYRSKYSEQIESILNSILNREKFSYNMNADPLYNQYKEQYVNNGKKAMLDTVANATALTGGYANSYALTLGNEAYGEYLNKLNDVALSLYDRAYAKYKDYGDSQIDKITLLGNLDDSDYSKYRDEISDYYTNGEYLLNKLNSLSESDYEAFLQEIAAYESDREYEYQKYIDALEEKRFYDELAFNREKFDEEMAFKKSEAERDQRNKDRSYSLSASRSSGGSSSKKSENSEKNGNTTVVKATIIPKTFQQFVYMTGNPGILTETEFNFRKREKEEYGSYQNYLKEMYYKYGNVNK